MSLRRVPRACERCRKQKLKCDPQRPCTLCERANVECIAHQDEMWKHYCPNPQVQGGHNTSHITNETQQVGSRGSKRASDFQGESGQRHEKRKRGQSAPLPQQTEPSNAESLDSGDAALNSSSTITLIQEAFRHHLAGTPEEADTSAFLPTPWMQPKAKSSTSSGEQGHLNMLHDLISHQFKGPKSVHRQQATVQSIAERDLAAVLPTSEAAFLLVDNYFDRIHWFMLLFHQREFRDKFQRLYASEPGGSQQSTSRPRSRLADVAVLLAVMATSLQYTNDLQKSQLALHGINADLLKDRMLTALRLRLLDILSVGTIEVVQTLVLLGSYYLFHGEPELAWPLCGCALRIAQALNLHRKFPRNGPAGSAVKPSNAARKRCWWAVYEIETFCSMLYGFPLSISDSDCDIDPLDPYDESSASGVQDHSSTEPSLLHYKCAMSTLSAIVKSALVDLYGTQRDRDPQDNPIIDQASRLPSVVKKVERLGSRLLDWHANLPQKLQLGNLDAGFAARQQSSDALSADGQGHSQIPFEEHIFQLQTLALKLAFENAKILIHRPLLSLKIITRPNQLHHVSNDHVDPCASAINTCRESALQISLVQVCPIIKRAADTYAAAFMSLHLFTAAVTICIITSLDPLNPKSQECKLGVCRLMEMQTLLKDKSIVASQGLDITRRLMSLTLTKEINVLFGNHSSLANSSVETPAESQARFTVPGVDTSIASNLSDVVNSSITPGGDGSSTQALENQDAISTGIDPTIFDPASFEFGENLSMTEALLDFGQIINLPTNRSMDCEQLNVVDPQQVDTLDNCFVGQDQGWIWGWGM